MKNTKKYILICLAVILVLGGGVALLFLTEPQPEPLETESSVSTEETVKLIEKEEADIETVEITDNTGTSILVQTDKYGDGTIYTYAYEGYEDYEVDSTSLSTNLRNLMSLTSSKDLGEVEDLATYGLTGDETVTIKLNYDDGTSQSFDVGITGANTAGRYMNFDGQVHIADIGDILLNSAEENLTPYSYTSYPIDYLDGNGAVNRFQTFTYERPSDDVKLTFENIDNVYMMTYPVQASTSFTIIENLLAALTTFEATGIEKIRATEEDLVEYGLDVPYATITYTIDENDHSLAITEQKNGVVYLIADGNTDVIYYVTPETVEPWANLEPMDVRSYLLYLPAIMDSDDFSMQIFDTTLEIDMSREVDEEKSTETEVGYSYSGTMNGKEIEYSDNITTIYGEIISMSAISLEQLAHEEEPTAVFTTNYYEGGSDVVSYYHSTEQEDRYVVYLNDVYIGTSKDSEIDKLYESVKEFIERNTAE